MKGLVTQIIVCLALIAGQSFYLAARAESAQTSKLDELALVQPSTAQMATSKDALPEEGRLLQAENQLVPGVAIYASSISGDEANRLAKDGVFIGDNSKENYIDLKGGNVLLNPEKDLVVGTRLGKIYIGSGASVFVVDSGDDVVVYDLLQTKPKQVAVVTVETNKHRLTLEPGRVLVLTAQNTNDFEKLAIDCHRVAYRNAQAVALPAGTIKAFAADFSIASAMTAIQPLKRLTVSKNREDKIAVERMVKAAVLLGDFAASPGQQPGAADQPVVNVKADTLQIGLRQ